MTAEYGQAALLLRCVPSGGSRDDRGRRREVTVTTIHQPKGLEWDVAITGSLDFDPQSVDPVGRSLLPYCGRGSFEPADRIADLDHARQSYVAFSRSRYLLVLTASPALAWSYPVPEAPGRADGTVLTA